MTAPLVPVICRDRVGRSDGLAAGRHQRDVERAGAIGQGVVGRQDRLRVAAGELDRARVAGRGVVEGVFGGDCEANDIRPRPLLAALTTKCVAAAALTLTVPLLPVIELSTCRSP